jgi:hypothetical protein
MVLQSSFGSRIPKDFLVFDHEERLGYPAQTNPPREQLLPKLSVRYDFIDNSSIVTYILADFHRIFFPPSASHASSFRPVMEAPLPRVCSPERRLDSCSATFVKGI